MGYAVILGLPIGETWMSLVGARLRHLPFSLRAPAPHVSTFVAVTTLSRFATSELRSRAFLPDPSASIVSSGLIAGFAWSSWFVATAHIIALAAGSLAASPLSAQYQCSPLRPFLVPSSLAACESSFA